MIAKIVVVLGTRPEVIKMAPVIGALRAAPKVFDVQLFVVGQQMEILDAALAE